MESQYIKTDSLSQSDKWAKIISFMFDGSFISIPVFIIICMVVVEDKMAALSWALLCILFGMMIPFLYVFFLYRKNKIYDIHIPEKSNRMKPLLFTLLSYITGLVVLYILNAPLFLKRCRMGKENFRPSRLWRRMAVCPADPAGRWWLSSAQKCSSLWRMMMVRSPRRENYLICCRALSARTVLSSSWLWIYEAFGTPEDGQSGHYFT